jgi:hypothetical protein
MANGDDGVTTIHVNVFLAFIVPDLASFAFDYIDIEKRIYVK